MKRSYEEFVTRLESVNLKSEIENRTIKQHVTLRELYEGPDRAPSVSAARRSVYAWLSKSGKGLNEIARLFDRAPNGVRKMLNGKKRK